MVISSLFQSTTDCPEPGEKATDAGGLATPRPAAAAAAVAGAATPATTAAAARKTAVFRVLRILRCPLRVGIGWRYPPARPRATAAQDHLLTRVVPERCSTSPVKCPTAGHRGARCGTTGNAAAEGSTHVLPVHGRGSPGRTSLTASRNAGGPTIVMLADPATHTRQRGDRWQRHASPLQDTEVAAFRDRSLASQAFRYVFVDATYCKARVGRTRHPT